MKSKIGSEEFNFCTLTGKEGSFIVGYRIQRSSRLKNLQIQVKSRDFVILKLPNRCSEKRALSFFRENSDWVIESLKKQPKIIGLKDHLVSKPKLSAFGKELRVVFKFRSNYIDYELNRDRSEVEIYLANFENHELRLRQILKAIAKEVVPHRVYELSEKHGVKAYGVTIRDQQMRWGSCSETAGISLNWRIILLSPELQDHIILHELAHLRHFNHSAQFYRLLEDWDHKSQKHSDEIDRISHQFISMGRST